jgi:hypothetical protein
MQTRTGFSVACCQPEDREALSTKLFELSQITWATINSAHRHGLGFEKIARNSLRVTLPAAVTEDATIIAFRYNGKRPMLGYRDGRIFYILFLDWNFNAYPHGP